MNIVLMEPLSVSEEKLKSVAQPPIAENHPLFSAKNVVATPHVAFATAESLDRRAEIAFTNVTQWLEGTVQNRML